MTDDDRDLAGPILAFVGGLLILVSGVVALWLGSQSLALASSWGLPQAAPGAATWIGVSGVVFGLAILLGSLWLGYHPDRHRTGGFAILVLAVLSVFLSPAGPLDLGFVLAVLGGTVGVAFGPRRPPRATEVTCVKCGRASSLSTRYCPDCGEKL